MKRSLTIIIFIVSQLALVCAYIHRESQRINVQYIYQNQKKELAQLSKQEDLLEQNLLKLESLNSVNHYARQNLNLKPLSMAQVKKYKDQDENTTF